MFEIDLTDQSVVTEWYSVNDGVMGGRSSGGISFDNGLLFRGVINTNGGGFSSIRYSLPPDVLADAEGLRFRVRSDGRTYKATFRTNVTYFGRQISFQAEIPTEGTGDWEFVDVRFADLKGSIFGRPVRRARFDPAEVRSIGIIIADKIDGPFRLEVSEIEAVN